uniref:Hypothetical conserved protein n=1 Tax=uncultured Chloroflexota bacterium TaxID=166587 RepID=H5SN30_9CHLR|nr:hypothetical conserved protein [uncultured Chloroflexota bacterium]
MGNFITFLLVLFALAALLRIDFFFTILYLYLGVYLVSRFWLQQILKHLEISRTLPRRAFWGETVTVSLKLQNQSRLPVPWLRLNESFPVALATPPFVRQVITLGGKAGYHLQYSLKARKRGYYRIGPLTLETGDLLGIKEALSDRHEADELIIYPKIVPLSRLGLPTHSPQTILPTPLPLFQDPTRLIGVRDYLVGDNPRHIHWPATAATGRLLVKQFQPAIARDNAIFLNLNRADYAQQGYPEPAIELAIVTAASLAHHIIVFEKLPLGLVTTGFDPLTGHTQRFKLPPGKGRDHLGQILEVLARVQSAEEEAPFLESIRQEAVHLAWGTTLIIITSHPSDDLVASILFLKRSGFPVSLVLVDPPRTRLQLQPGFKQELNFPVFKIRREEDIKEWSPRMN